MKIFWAIVVSAIIVFVSGLLFNILKMAMGSGTSFIGVIIQLSPFMIGIWLIKYSWTKITYSEEPKESIIDNTQSLAKAVINHSKEFVQEVKPTINNYIEKHNKIDEIVIKNDSKIEDNMISENINEDEIYEQVMIEIEEDNKVKSTWAKALAQSDGDKDKAESLYIKSRFVDIKNEINNIELLKAKELNRISEENKKYLNDITAVINKLDQIEKSKEELENITRSKVDMQSKSFYYLLKVPKIVEEKLWINYSKETFENCNDGSFDKSMTFFYRDRQSFTVYVLKVSGVMYVLVNNLGIKEEFCF